MTILMRSPEGAQAQVSSTEAEVLKKLGWKERSYDDYKPIAKQEEKVTIQPVAPQAEKPRLGRPPKNEVGNDHVNRAKFSR